MPRLQRAQVNRLQYLFSAFRDANSLLSSASSSAGKERFVRAYRDEVLGHFSEVSIQPLPSNFVLCCFSFARACNAWIGCLRAVLLSSPRPRTDVIGL